MVSRLSADRLYEGRLDAIAAPFHQSLALTLLLCAISAAAVLRALGLPAGLPLWCGSALAAVVGAQWTALAVGNGLCSPGLVMGSLVSGAASSFGFAVAGARLSVEGYLLGLTLGQCVTLSVLMAAIGRALPETCDEDEAIWPAFRNYALLAAAGLAFNAALWIDKFVVQLVADRQTAAFHSTGSIIAWLATVPCLAWIFVEVETTFQRSVQEFYVSLESAGSPTRRGNPPAPAPRRRVRSGGGSCRPPRAVLLRSAARCAANGRHPTRRCGRADRRSKLAASHPGRGNRRGLCHRRGHRRPAGVSRSASGAPARVDGSIVRRRVKLPRFAKPRDHHTPGALSAESAQSFSGLEQRARIGDLLGGLPELGLGGHHQGSPRWRRASPRAMRVLSSLTSGSTRRSCEPEASAMRTDTARVQRPGAGHRIKSGYDGPMGLKPRAKKRRKSRLDGLQSVQKDWKDTFRQGENNLYPCPSCRDGKLSPDFATFQKKETTESARSPVEDDDPYATVFRQYRFAGLLVCSAKFCEEVVTISGRLDITTSTREGDDDFGQLHEYPLALQQDVDAAQIQRRRFAGQPLGNALAVRRELGLLVAHRRWTLLHALPHLLHLCVRERSVMGERQLLRPGPVPTNRLAVHACLPRRLALILVRLPPAEQLPDAPKREPSKRHRRVRFTRRIRKILRR